MSKTFRIIQLINLLYTRRSVTMKTIKETCGIPERTAYRYLNTVSEANIPVYYDKNAQAYRLNTDAHMAIHDISFGESVITVIALKVLAALVGRPYQSDLEDLTTKLLVRQGAEVEAILGPLTRRLSSQLGGIDVSEHLSSALIHAAVCCGRKVRLTKSNGRGAIETVGISSPRLHFRDAWLLTDMEVDQMQSWVADIERVVVL